MPTTARLLLPACDPPPLNTADLLSALRVELLGHGVTLDRATRSTAPSDPGALLAVDAPSCQGSRLMVRVLDPESGRATQEAVDLSDTPRQDRGRVLALAMAELLERTWSTLTAQGRPPEAQPNLQLPPSVEGPTPSTAWVSQGAPTEAERSRQEAPPEPPRLLSGALLGVRSYPLFSGTTFGVIGQLNVRLSSRAPLRLIVDLSYFGGGATDELGVIQTHLLGGGLALLITGGAARVQADAGLRLDLDWIRARGRPVDERALGETLDGAQVAVSASVDLRVRVRRASWLVASLKVGYVALGLEVLAEDQRLGGVGGPALGVDVGFLFSI